MLFISHPTPYQNKVIGQATRHLSKSQALMCGILNTENHNILFRILSNTPLSKNLSIREDNFHNKTKTKCILPKMKAFVFLLLCISVRTASSAEITTNAVSFANAPTWLTENKANQVVD